MTARSRDDSEAERPRHYLGAAILAWLLTLMLSVASLLVIAGGNLTQAVGDTLSRGGPSADDLQILALPIAAVVIVPVAVAVTSTAAIRALRIALYVRRLHAHSTDYLRRYAPLHEMGIDPSIVPFEPSKMPLRAARSISLTRHLDHARPTLLLGEPASGKTVALYSTAAYLTRRRMLLARAFSRRRLPVLLSLGAVERAEDDVLPVTSMIATQLRFFGSAGLATRTSKLLRRGKIILLCDDIDGAPPAARSEICRQLAALVSTYPRTSVVATCRLESYRDGLQTERSLRQYNRMVLSGLTSPQIDSALRSLPTASRMTRPRRRDAERDIQRLALRATASSPASLQAIRELLASRELVPGRGRVLVHAARSRLKGIPSAGLEQSDSEAFLAALAAGLRRDERRTVHRGEEVATVEATWETASTSARVPAAPIEDEVAKQTLIAAIDSGILVLTPDGVSVGFANGYLEAAYAALWLQLTDDGFGALRSDLLRPEWQLPLAMWATLTPEPGDLAKRILRLADTPDAVALRAGLATPTDAVALILATALVVLGEGTVAALTEENSALTQDATASMTSEHLRDVLDLANIYLAQPEGASHLAAQLYSAADYVGPEFMDALGHLAADARLNRLARSQLIALLGIAPDDASVNALVRLLEDMDPMIRQSVNQAFVHAGPLGLDRLRQVVLTQRGRLRERANEVMALLGDDAIDSAIDMLSNPDDVRRASAATTLGELRAVRAEGLLIEKLADTSLDVRLASVQALARLGTIRGRDALRELLPHADAALRAASVEALGTLHAEDAVRDICGLLADSSPDVRSAAAQALGRIGDEAAVPALEARRADDDIWVRQAVETALRRLGRTPAQHGILTRTQA